MERPLSASLRRGRALVAAAQLASVAPALEAQRPAAARAPAGTSARAAYPPYAGDSTGTTRYVEVRVRDGAPGARRFELRTTAPQREGDPQRRTVE